ncbi:MAG: hypothetical protein WC208_03065 [Gallionella sp.]|jgi:hypothetical protein
MINSFDLEKKRELWFAKEPADQVARALTILSGLTNLQAFATAKAHVLEIHYNLRDYTLAGLEHALEQEGFCLDQGLLHQVSRNIIYYCEDTSRHNMEIRGHVTKKNERDVFVEVGAHHLHKEHASKPPELREYE